VVKTIFPTPMSTMADLAIERPEAAASFVRKSW